MAVVKIIELVGSSKTSTDDAAKQALAQAQGTLRNIRAVDIVSTGIRGENLDEYRAHVRVAFLVEGTEVELSSGKGPQLHEPLPDRRDQLVGGALRFLASGGDRPGSPVEEIADDLRCAAGRHPPPHDLVDDSL